MSVVPTAPTPALSVLPSARDGDAARVRALHDLRLLDRGPEARFDRITNVAAALFGVLDAQLTLVDRRRTQIKSGRVLQGDVARSDSFCTHTIRDAEVMVVPDAREDPRFADNRFVTGADGLRFYAGCPITSASGERIGALCLVDRSPRQFSEHEQAALVELARWIERELASGEELDRAAEVQAGLLPKQPPAIDGWDVAGGCVPASFVGGDLFDWYPTRCGTAVTLADVMGKGLAAAIVMATMKAILRAGTRGGDLVGAICLAADSLDEDFGHLDGFVTAFHALLDPDSGRVAYVDAGHGLAIVARADGDVVRLPGDGLPIGMLDDTEWFEDHVDLAPGDALIVASDGLLDVHQQVEAVLDRCRSEAAQASSAQALVDALLHPARTRSISDDLTVVVARRTA